MAEPRECIRCHRIRTIASRELCSSCYSYERQLGDLNKYPPSNAKKKKRYDNCIDCSKYIHIFGKDRCKKCYLRWFRSQPEQKKRHAEQMRAYRAEKPEIYQAIEKRRGQTEKRRTWRDKYNHQYYETNGDKLRQYQVEWRQNNKEQFAGYMRQAAQRRKVAEGITTEKQWKRLVDYYCPDGRCLKCKEKFVRDITTRKLTQDHVIPLNQGGTHWPSNMQPLCYACNSSKGDHSTTDFRPDKGEFARSLMVNQ